MIAAIGYQNVLVMGVKLPISRIVREKKLSYRPYKTVTTQNTIIEK